MVAGTSRTPWHACSAHSTSARATSSVARSSGVMLPFRDVRLIEVDGGGSDRTGVPSRRRRPTVEIAVVHRYCSLRLSQMRGWRRCKRCRHRSRGTQFSARPRPPPSAATRSGLRRRRARPPRPGPGNPASSAPARSSSRHLLAVRHCASSKSPTGMGPIRDPALRRCPAVRISTGYCHVHWIRWSPHAPIAARLLPLANHHAGDGKSVCFPGSSVEGRSAYRSICPVLRNRGLPVEPKGRMACQSAFSEIVLARPRAGGRDRLRSRARGGSALLAAARRQPAGQTPELRAYLTCPWRVTPAGPGEHPPRWLPFSPGPTSWRPFLRTLAGR